MRLAASVAALSFCVTWVVLRTWDEGPTYLLPTIIQIGLLVAVLHLATRRTVKS